MAQAIEIFPGQKTKTFLFCIVNIMADVLLTQGAKAPAAMVFTYFCWNIPVPAAAGIIFPAFILNPLN